MKPEQLTLTIQPLTLELPDSPATYKVFIPGLLDETFENITKRELVLTLRHLGYWQELFKITDKTTLLVKQIINGLATIPKALPLIDTLMDTALDGLFLDVRDKAMVEDNINSVVHNILKIMPYEFPTLVLSKYIGICLTSIHVPFKVKICN